MGELIEVYREHEIRWTKTGYRVINPQGVPVGSEAKTVQEAKALIDRSLDSDEAKRPAPPVRTQTESKPTARTTQEPKKKPLSPEQQPRCRSCGTAPGYMPGQLCGPCWLKAWRRGEVKPVWKQDQE